MIIDVPHDLSKSSLNWRLVIYSRLHQAQTRPRHVDTIRKINENSSQLTPASAFFRAYLATASILISGEFLIWLIKEAKKLCHFAYQWFDTKLTECVAA